MRIPVATSIPFQILDANIFPETIMFTIVGLIALFALLLGANTPSSESLLLPRETELGANVWAVIFAYTAGLFFMLSVLTIY